MKLGKFVEFSFRSILRNRMRSLLTSLGIIIGVCSVIVMVSIGQGSQARIAEQIAAMGTNLIMVMPPRGPRGANRLSLSDKDKIKSEASYISAISGETRGSFEIVGGFTSWSTSVMGVEGDYFTIKNWTIQEGSSFTEEDLKARNKVAVIGSTIATELFDNQNVIGSKLRIGKTPFTVVGVLGSKGSNNMGEDQDDIIMVPLDTALSRLSKERFLDSIEISVISEELMEPAQNEIEAILKEAHRIGPTDTEDFTVVNQAEIIETASETSKTLTTLLAAIAGVSLLVGGIGIMNIMLVSVTERTREIGIRMSVGARKRDILFQFLAEAVILSLLGGTIGILLALGISETLKLFFSIPTLINPAVILISALFAAAVGVFFGYYPARKAAGLYPIDALRYE